MFQTFWILIDCLLSCLSNVSLILRFCCFAASVHTLVVSPSIKRFLFSTNHSNFVALYCVQHSHMQQMHNRPTENPLWLILTLISVINHLVSVQDVVTCSTDKPNAGSAEQGQENKIQKGCDTEARRQVK